uniref:NADH dehydrogenase subunit 6 n=1 Tax=Ramisyllis multicaudata TaxID=1166726 RepID=A0A0K0YD62_RAMMU|nr:NADH dehydrogenase subunit 6 [Ramisyllis multicaudata]AKS48923.1 NADH dehydrogenase subunit 6 [Ramisyllis multicaudata]
MMYKLIPSIIIMTIWTFLSTSTPIMLGMLVIMLALLTTLMSMTFLPSWLSMIIFIVYVGGLLVMFSYFLAIQMNFLIKNNMLSPLLLMLGTLWLLLMMTYTPLAPLSMTNSINHPTLLMTPMNSPTTIIIALNLLLILIIVVFLTHLQHSPLRPNK